MQVFRDYRLIECETTMRRLIPVAIREVAVFDTEDVAPVVHAHWINGEECSECGGLALMDYDGKAHIIQSEYCPHCGAKMDEE